MTPILIDKARKFRDTYAELLTLWRRYNAPTLDEAVAICNKFYRTEFSLLDELNNLIDTDSYVFDDLERLYEQLCATIDIPEIFTEEGLIWNTIDGQDYCSCPSDWDIGEQKAARLLLNEAVFIGEAWTQWDANEHPVVTINKILNWLRLRIESSKNEVQTTINESEAMENLETSDNSKRDIPRSQSIALLYAVFRKFGVTQKYTDIAISRLIEAVTGGKIRDGKNSYARKHHNDKLEEKVNTLFDEFIKSEQSPN